MYCTDTDKIYTCTFNVSAHKNHTLTKRNRIKIRYFNFSDYNRFDYHTYKVNKAMQRKAHKTRNSFAKREEPCRIKLYEIK